MANIARLIAMFMWVWGIVLAKGFWLTTLAVILPIYGWFLVVRSLVT